MPRKRKVKIKRNKPFKLKKWPRSPDRKGKRLLTSK